MVLENQVDIFCIFHDGSFSAFIRNQDDIEFTVDIYYLAELINPGFSTFKGKLKNCARFEYHVWGEEHRIINDLNTLGTLYLQIGYAELMDNYIVVKCFSDDENCGGNLVIVTDDIIIFDESGQEIKLERLVETCKLYWNSNHKR